MSLENLLRDSDESSKWSSQRRKLIRVVIGLATMAAALIGGTALLLHSHRPRVASTGAQEANASAVAQLLKIQEEAKDLQQEVHRARRTASIEEEDEQERPYRRGAGPSQVGEVLNYEPGDGFTNLETNKENLYVPTGAVFQAQLLTPIKTSVEKTMVMAEITNEYRMDMKRRILKGSRLIGHARLNPVLKGVIVEFETLVSPDGLESPISGLALSRNALPEIEGLFFSDKMVNYGTALAFGFLSGFADASRTTDVTLVGALPNVSVNNSVATGFSTAAFQIADEALQDIRNHSVEYVVVPAGERVFVALTHRYDIPQGKKNDLY